MLQASLSEVEDMSLRRRTVWNLDPAIGSAPLRLDPEREPNYRLEQSRSAARKRFIAVDEVKLIYKDPFGHKAG